MTDRVDTLTVPYDERYRRRILLTGASGADFLLDLPEAVVLQSGDGLELEEGGYIEVIAAVEPLMEAEPGDTVPLARLAWHIGNRHLEAEITATSIKLRRDHVIADMLRGLGANVRDIEAPFSPEGGAYGHGRTHSHDHGSHHGHDHDPSPHQTHQHRGGHPHSHALDSK